jgi:hypothetical protein
MLGKFRVNGQDYAVLENGHSRSCIAADLLPVFAATHQWHAYNGARAQNELPAIQNPFSCHYPHSPINQTVSATRILV